MKDKLAKKIHGDSVALSDSDEEAEDKTKSVYIRQKKTKKIDELKNKLSKQIKSKMESAKPSPGKKVVTFVAGSGGNK